MSIQHLESAAEVDLHATSKLVLMALADDANKITRITFPGLPKLMLWSGASERRVAGIIEELIVQQYLARRAFGMPTRKAEFLIFPTLEEIEALDAKNPNLNRVSQEAIARVMKADEARLGKAAAAAARAAKKATPVPVDNPNEWVPPVAPTETVMGATESGMPATGGTPTVITSPSSNSHIENSHQGAVQTLDADDQKSATPNIPTPARVFGHHGIDQAALAASVGHIFADTGINDDELRAIATEILGKATTHVTNPTAYVVKAIRNDSIEWQSKAYAIALTRGNAALAGGNPF